MHYPFSIDIDRSNKGLGLAVVNPLTALEYLGQGLAMRPLSRSIPFRVSLVRPERRPSSALVDQFVKALKDEAAALIKKLR